MTTERERSRFVSDWNALQRRVSTGTRCDWRRSPTCGGRSASTAGAGPCPTRRRCCRTAVSRCTTSGRACRGRWSWSTRTIALRRRTWWRDARTASRASGSRPGAISRDRRGGTRSCGRSGIGDVAVAACRDSRGCWGWIEAYRDGGDRPFEQEDVVLLGAVAPVRVRAATRHHELAPGRVRQPTPPGVLVLDADLRPVSWTESARAWAAALPSAQLFALWGMLPSVVYPVATLARAGAGGGGGEALSLVQAVDGRWVMIEAAPLEGERDGEIVVSLRSAAPSETFKLLCRAYALSRRERDLVALLVAGLDTRGVATRLSISPHTVQDHLKSIFDKVGIHSRRELLATLGAAAS